MNSESKENRRGDLDKPKRKSKQSSEKDNHKNTDEQSYIISQGQSESVISNGSDSEVKTTRNDVKNAFDFMMDSRSKSIGQNSPGKDLEQADECCEAKNERRKKLSDRKDMLKAWAERKGSKKREIEDRERGVVIERKLEERSKRLKKMLKI
ncbi:hypothetical protein FQR65_LT05941 [Abscondita terminalis]|nr:hypothetical protein FQR65_LT05941 [Abscondita terminalis]